MDTHRVRHGATKTLRIAWACVLVAWIALIWGHSLRAGPESAEESAFIVQMLRPAFEMAGITDVQLMTFIVRKCAHFSEYGVLGVVVAANCYVQGLGCGHGFHIWRVVLLHALFAGVALVDEFVIQRLTPGRSGNLRDVGIDCAGLVAGSVVAWCVIVWYRTCHHGSGPAKQ